MAKGVKPISYRGTNLTDPQTAVTDIAAQLQETNPEALKQISRIVQHLGIATAYQYLQETLDIETGRGMLTKDNGRPTRSSARLMIRNL